MILNNYLKYFACVLLAHLQCVNTDLISPKLNETHLKESRGIVGLWFGRPCKACVCGRATRTKRFIGGEHTGPHEFPWLATIYVKSHNRLNGVLINDRFVLTAASHLNNITANNVKVGLGQYNRCNNDVLSLQTTVSTIIKHPLFDYHTKAKDLALLKLSRPVKFEKRISSVCLPNPAATFLGQVGTLTGWPDDKEHDHIKSCIPRKLGLPILGHRECVKGDVNIETFHSDSGCAGVLKTDSIACDHDTGTPVLYRSYNNVYDVIGILSDNNHCGKGRERPAVFTKVGPNVSWILKTTKDACYCAK